MAGATILAAVSRHGRVAAIVVGAVLPFTPVAATAQDAVPSTPLAGQVLLDGDPVPGASVSLHQVSSGGSGQVAITVTDANGGFSFDRADPSEADFAFYFATAEHQSVTFFGPILRVDERPDRYVIEVYDTAASLPEPIRVAARHMVLIPENTGSWEVNEILRIQNPTNLALVSPDESAAWSFGIPEGATDFEVGPGDVLPHELVLMENRVLHITPIVPGTREVLIRYRLPADARTGLVPITEPTDSFHLYVRQPAHLTAVTGLQSQRMVDIEDEQYLQYSATNLADGSTIELRWSRPGPPLDPVLVAVGLSVAVLAAAAVVAFRNRLPASPAV